MTKLNYCLLADTDSLMYKIDSKYSKDSKYDKTNKLIIGKMKNGTYVVPVKGFVELKAKMFSYVTKDQHECKKAKVINNSVVQSELKYENYKNVLLNATYMNHEINRIQSKNHNIGTYRINKVYLSCYDDKKYILEDEHSRFTDNLRKKICRM